MTRDTPSTSPPFRTILCNGWVATIRTSPWRLERLVLDPAKCTPKDPENAFFLYLRDGPTSEAKQSVLDRCPAPGRLPVWRGDWIFQRHGPDLTWKHSMYWDCIFMARLLGIR
jgi:hypothetical protein